MKNGKTRPPTPVPVCMFGEQKQSQKVQEAESGNREGNLGGEGAKARRRFLPLAPRRRRPPAPANNLPLKMIPVARPRFRWNQPLSQRRTGV